MGARGIGATRAGVIGALLGAAAATSVGAQVPPSHDYTLHCSGCHRADGGGVGEAVPSLLGLDRFLRTAEGRAYLIRAPGVAQAPLSDERLAALMNWVVEHFGTTGRTPGYTGKEVGRLRSDPLRDATELRVRLLSEEEDRD